MNGYGSHTYQWINAAGERFWVKYHFKTNQGIDFLTQEEADRIAGASPDHHRMDLFESIAPELWERCRQDPVRLLGEISTARFAELAKDADTVVTVRELADELESYLTEPRWYQLEREEDPTLPAAVGYFSMEFGVSEVLPFYSGGLGVLAGDHLKAASDLGVPLIGLGLLYRSGYFRQSLSLDGWQLEHYPALDPQGLPLRLITAAIDQELNEKMYIVPGLGDAGDRQFGGMPRF